MKITVLTSMAALLMLFSSSFTTSISVSKNRLPISAACLKAKGEQSIGMFINNGTRKIDHFDCYDFDNLMVEFEADDELLGYDYITVSFHIDPYPGGVRMGNNVSSDSFGISYTKGLLKSWRENNKIKLWVFKDGQNLAEASEFTGKNRSVLTRTRMEFSNDRNYLSQYKFSVIVSAVTYGPGNSITAQKQFYDIELPMRRTFNGAMPRPDYSHLKVSQTHCFPDGGPTNPAAGH